MANTYFKKCSPSLVTREIIFEISWLNDYHQENKELIACNDMGERNSYSLLMGVENGVVTVEISMEVSQKSYISPIWPKYLSLWYIPRGC